MDLRKRGWSIHSEDQTQQRDRADSHMTCDTEPSLSEAEKLHLLNSAFGDSVDAGDVEVPRNTSDVNRSMSDSDGGSGEDYLTMPGEGGSEGKNNDGPTKKKGEEPPKKRRKTGEEGDAIDVDNELNGVEKNSSDDDSSSEHESEGASGAELKTKAKGKRPYVKLTQKQQDQLDFAKNKLSKWAARLFDPNRPRGLVEAPAVIPLNDEFLTAFGKRERDYDELTGREVEIDKTSLDVIDVSDGDDENENSNQKTTDGKGTKNFSEMAKCKVKISNLSYKTTTATIVRNFGSIGSVVDVNLILNDNGQSSGRAYVVFEDHESALSCVGKMNEKQMEGRTLYISLASASSSGRKSLNGPKKPDSRYWERDISTKCNCCGEVGHIAKNCPNEQKLKPCGLCAKLGHDSWSCPEKSVCFNCGLPGHVVEIVISEEASPNVAFAPFAIEVDILDSSAESYPGMPPHRMQYVCNAGKRDI
eukprot:CAMPEP_0172316228 /NCGR_PEP_ID=MMETSP1058-20130122/27542_1 /TAXON_ID=83371 /ORGANISM="Detonula confervacea, Strain CCMP 353" /LENGTH=473 /DNA_ID=CAMNT_0013030493 /DNA_START=98 /DNA_END=1520 /DNA_ORIENTATION=+